MHGNKKLTRQNSVCRIVVRLCMILSLWHGPFPFLHCHESELVELPTPSSIVELRHHLTKFHDGAELDQDHEFGWHFHWILPNWSQRFHDLSQDEQPADDFTSVDSIVVDSSIPTSIDRLFDGELCQYSSIRLSTDTTRTVWRNERGQQPQRKRELPLVMRV